MSFHRRAFLGGLAAATGVSCTHAGPGQPSKTVGVIGGGIIGASIALQLARAGAKVLLFERTEPAAGATRASVAWIDPVVNDAHYMRLRLESMQAWREDDRALGMRVIWVAP